MLPRLISRDEGPLGTAGPFGKRRAMRCEIPAFPSRRGVAAASGGRAVQP
jgi:hypothetical protein